MLDWLFYIALIGECLYGLALAISIICPRKRIWPPPKWKSWQFFFVWTSLIVTVIASIGTAYLSWNSFIFKGIWHYVFGGMLVVIGYVIYVLARKELGVAMMMGVKDRFISTGIYKYSRNPMYVGDALMLIGGSLIVNSLSLMIICGVGVVLFLLTPYAEEPWLSEQYGDVYNQYLNKVSRFVKFY